MVWPGLGRPGPEQGRQPPGNYRGAGGGRVAGWWFVGPLLKTNRRQVPTPLPLHCFCDRN